MGFEYNTDVVRVVLVTLSKECKTHYFVISIIIITRIT
jgi:hypothetical protein